MTKFSTVIAGFSAIFLSWIVTNAPANAASITISNSGFEQPNLEGVAPIVGNEFFTFETPPGWKLYDPSGLIPTETNLSTSYPGVWNPSADFYTNEAPEGDNIGAIFLNQNPGSGVVGLSQTLEDTLEANTEYTLQVEVGNPGFPFFAGFPGYKIELLAGNNIIAEDNNTLKIVEGGFATSTIFYGSSINDANLGQPLQIRLLNTLEDNGLEVNFDDVRLSTQSTPIPESNLIISLLVFSVSFLGIKRVN